ncbi:cyclin-dependent kinase inhibitor 5-like [Olea europaea var. sylvestris]|uniref:cyclin-dependent kinase inhibitor 5-like n=1 Tax=Olea europaea var. sylvestris TaxID=158386 RepID=UPI000C1D4CBF|nr:cyclin-dependent kinase inhibitor 5-like [Olea europaea var. sylvestris]
MGKYIRKSKTTGVLAVSHAQCSLGVRTRSKTLALQRLENSSAVATAPAEGCDDGCYMQLRNRRLEKPAPSVVAEAKRLKHHSLEEPNSNKARVGPNSVENRGKEKEKEKLEEKREESSVEASFGENVLEYEDKRRNTRESTPCSLIRDSDAIRTSGSSDRPTTGDDANSRMQNPMLRDIPTANEINEFFSRAENQLHKQFVEKYNFDPLTDKPLLGRYEWVKLKP